MSKLNDDVTAALKFAYVWTEADVWPVDAMTFAARLGVVLHLVATADEFVACVPASVADDRTLYCVSDWCKFVPLHGLIAVHCTQRLVRCAGLDAQDFELVARLCHMLTGYLGDRSSLDWQQKVAQHLRDVARVA